MTSRCKYEVICGLFGDPEPGDGLCILHSARSGKSQTQFAAALALHIGSRGNNFKQFVFPEGQWFPHASSLENADFSNAIFLGAADFSRTNFRGVAHFTEAQFSKDVCFAEAQFENEADFSSVEFHKNVSFRTTEFIKKARFSKSKFGGTACVEDGARESGDPIIETICDFAESKFHDTVDFEGAVVSQRVDFGNTQFASRANFASVDFRSGVSFTDSLFRDNVGFVSASFNSGADFLRAHFADAADFSSVKFLSRDGAQDANKVNFRQGTFENKVDYSSVEFQTPGDFIGAVFNGQADFTDAVFHRDVHFTGAEFRGFVLFKAARFARLTTVSFRAARFGGNALFTPPAIPPGVSPTEADLLFYGVKEVDFSEVDASSAKAIIFRHADLRCARLLHTDSQVIEFTGVLWRRLSDFVWPGWPRWIIGVHWPAWLRWSRRNGVIDEVMHFVQAARRSPTANRPVHYTRRRFRPYSPGLETLYRGLRKSHEHRQQYAMSGDFHYGEKEMRRLNDKLSRCHRLLLCGYRNVSGYGERYLRPLGWALVTLLITAFLCCFGSAGATGASKAAQAPASSIPQAVLEWLEYFGSCLLYSLRVMILLRPNEFTPQGLIGVLVNTAQSTSGPLLFGLFAIAIRQKLRR